MKKTKTMRSIITTTLMLAIVLCIFVSFGAIKASAATAPSYIASLGIAQDADKADAINELSGHTIIDFDLNSGCGSSSDYVYMGYKTTTDPGKAITGIVFRVGENPPNSITYGNYTFYLVGGSYEANTAVDNVVDLNEDAKGAYIYTYVTRDLGYGAPLTAMTVNESSSKSGWITGTNTSGNVIDLNQGAGGDYIYLHYQRATALNPKVTFYTIVDGDFTTTLDNVTTTVYDNYNKFTPKFDFVKNPTAGGLTYRFVGWREDSEALAPTVTTVSLTADQCPKYYRGIYTNTVTLTFDANGGTGAPGSVSGTQYVSTDTGGAVPPGSTLRFYPFKHGGVSIKIPTQVPVKSGACEFSHWNRSGDGKDLKPGETITWYFPSTLTAAYKDHSYTDNICTVCGMINPAITPAVTLSKNDKVVGLYTTLADAITSAQSCTAADKAVVKLLKDIDLGNTSQSIRGGVFTLDLNGKLLSSTRDTWDVLQIRDGAQLTIDDSGIGGTIQLETGTAVYIYDGDLTLNGGTLTGINGVVISDNSGATINGGTVIGDSYAVNIKVGGAVTITGGSFTGGNYADIVNWGTVTLSGGTFPGGIKLENATLNAVLGNGYAYWQGDTMILPANDAKQITGGDVTVKTACPHKNGIKQNYINNGEDHTCTYSCCNLTVTEGHSYTATLLCACGAISPDAVATVSKNGTVVSAHATLDSAIAAARSAKATDEAVVKLLKDIDLGDNSQTISGGVFTIDLSGFEISCSDSGNGALYISGASTNVTIVDSGTDGKITGSSRGIRIENSGTATISGGTVHGITGVEANDSALNITGGKIYDNNDFFAVKASNSTVTVYGGTVSGYKAMNVSDSTLNIIGGSIKNANTGVEATRSTVTISGGTVNAGYAVKAYSNSTVKITGGSLTHSGSGVDVSDSILTISDGTISGGIYGVYATNSTATISGCSIINTMRGVHAGKSTVTISGGSISGNHYDIKNSGSSISLTLGEDGVGATFPGGITVSDTTLEDILGDGAAYWAGDTMLAVEDGVQSFTDKGDITVKAVHVHSFTGGACTCGALLGDVNGDGSRSIADIVLLNAHIKQKLTLSDDQLLLADLNRDGNVNGDDTALLQRVMLGKEFLT